MGWVHWSRRSDHIATDTLTFDMWPDVSDNPAVGRFPTPGFTHPDGQQACLFSSDSEGVVQRHLEWMRDYGIDGVWLQHFVVDLPDGVNAAWHPSRIGLPIPEHIPIKP